ncbi:hypothetical protein D9M71_613200 [compost metagenome]
MRAQPWIEVIQLRREQVTLEGYQLGNADDLRAAHRHVTRRVDLVTLAGIGAIVAGYAVVIRAGKALPVVAIPRTNGIGHPLPSRDSHLAHCLRCGEKLAVKERIEIISHGNGRAVR